MRSINSLPSEILLAIFSCLYPIEIVKLERVSKYFKEVLQNCSALLQKHFLSYYTLPAQNRQLHWKRILKRIKLCPLSNGLFLPYFTDGGAKGDLEKYFINKLIQQSGKYSSVKGQNVLIKYVYRGKANFIYENPLLYKISSDTFYIPDIENLHLNPSRKLPLIEKVVIGVPSRMYSLMLNAVFFCSMEKMETNEIIERFKSCNSKHKALAKGKKLGFECSYLKTRFATLVFFKKHLTPILPLFWIKIRYTDIIKPDILNIKLAKPVFAKFFYVLMVDGIINGPGANIDVSYIGPICREVSILN